MRLRFHQRTIEFLREIPIVSKTNVRLIERWERRHQVRLPPALREWYSLEGAEKRGCVGLVSNLNTESIQPLLKKQSDLHRRRILDLSQQFQVNDIGHDYEERWVVAQFDGTDDPPVKERIRGQEQNPYMGKRLRFSEYVFRSVWNLLVEGADQLNKSCFEATNTAVGPIELDYLLEHLTEVFRERRWRGKCSTEHPFKDALIKLFPFRFAFQHSWGLVLVECQGSPVKKSVEARWTLVGNTAESLSALGKLLWACGDFSRTLTAGNARSKAILTRLQRHYGRD
jgi:hypothetical protein